MRLSPSGTNFIPNEFVNGCPGAGPTLFSSRAARNACCCGSTRSEEHTSELQSQSNLVCRLLLEKNTTELDMPLGVHGAPGIHLPKIGVDRFTNYIQVHCLSFPFDQMTAMTALVSGGVFDRHPKLRVAFLESGVGWVPYFIDRMHEHYEKRGDWIPNGWKHDPREYVAAGNVWVS